MANRKDAWRHPPSRSRETGAGRDPRAPVGGVTKTQQGVSVQDRVLSECARPHLGGGRGCKDTTGSECVRLRPSLPGGGEGRGCKDTTGSECARLCPALLVGRDAKRHSHNGNSPGGPRETKSSGGRLPLPWPLPSGPCGQRGGPGVVLPLPEHRLPPRAPPSSPLLLFSSCSSWNSVSRFSSLFQLRFLQESAQAPYTRRAPNTYFHE